MATPPNFIWGTTSPVADGGTARYQDTENALTSGKLASWRNNGNELAYLQWDGTFIGGGGDGIYNVKGPAYGATGDGSTDEYTALNTARIAATILGGVLFFPPGSYRVETNLTFDADLTLWFAPGATLKPASGVVITINGDVMAGMFQVFDYSSSGTIRFGAEDHVIFVEWFGTDGTADQTEVNYTIDSLGEYGISDPGDKQRMSNWKKKGVVKMLGAYDLTGPILFETSTDEDNISRNGIVLDGEGTGVITINDAFVGVDRYYDKISAAQTIKGAIVMGAKNYGKEGGQTQMWNKIRGLEIQGKFSGGIVDVSFMGIWSEFSTWCEITDMRFYALGYGLKARCIHGSTLTNWITQRVPSNLTIHNDTPDIKTADPTSEWGTNGDEANANTIFGIRGNAGPMSVYTDSADLEDMVGFDFYNSGENNVDNLIHFGGPHALRDHNGAGITRAQKWNRFGKMEFAGQEGWGVKFDNKKLQLVDNLQVVYAVRDSIASANFDYTLPYIILNDVQACTFGDIIVDRDTARVGQKGGHSLALTGTSIENTFDSFVSIGGDAIEADATYSHLSVEDTSANNIFGKLQLGVLAGGTNNMLHGISVGNSCTGNDFGKVRITHQTGTYVDWGTSATNTMSASEGVAFAADTDTTPSAWNTKILKFNNDPSIDVTDLPDGFPGQGLVLMDIKAAGTPTTVKDNVGLKLAGDWTPAGIRDTLVLVYDNSKWNELTRSTN